MDDDLTHYMKATGRLASRVRLLRQAYHDLHRDRAFFRQHLQDADAEIERLRAVVDAARPLVLAVDEMMTSAARPVDVKEHQFLRVRQALGTIYQYAIDHPEGHLRIGEAT